MSRIVLFFVEYFYFSRLGFYHFPSLIGTLATRRTILISFSSRRKFFGKHRGLVNIHNVNQLLGASGWSIRTRNEFS